MTGRTIGIASREFRRLFAGGTVGGVRDEELLARFLNDRDEAAFAAIVERHGGMVLSVCRGVLRDGHAAQDAFQATFLVLVRKAQSVRGRGSLSSWLYRVAYRTAVHLNADAGRRQRLERQAGAMRRASNEVGSPAGDELGRLIYEEVNRLPENYRLAVVLCHLEERTHAEAAGLLGWTEGMVRGRVAKAREVLRKRLGRRGLTLSAAGVAAALGERSVSAMGIVVPMAWVDGAVKAGIALSAGEAVVAGTVSAAAVVVSEGVLRSWLMTGLKVGLGSMLAAGGVVLAVAWSAGAGDAANGVKGAEPGAAGRAVGAARAKVIAAKSAVGAGTVEMLEVRGRVVGPDGKGVSGARASAFYSGSQEVDSAAETTAGPDGRFAMKTPQWRGHWIVRNRQEMYPWIIGSAPGFGPGWISAVGGVDERGELTVPVVEEGPAVEGRIVDLEGRGVEGAMVKVEMLWLEPKGDMIGWLGRVEKGGIDGPWKGMIAIDSKLKTTTDREGRFRLGGLGRNRIAQVIVSGPAIATSQLFVVSHDGPTVRTKRGSRAGDVTYYSRKFDYAAPPTQRIEGVIRDNDTGKPIGGVKLRGMVFEERSRIWAPGVSASSDLEGRYRLTGLAKGAAYQISLEPGEALPYPSASFKVVDNASGLDGVRYDVNLKRGVVVSGRVTDKSTGLAVQGYVQCFSMSGNPRVRQFPGYRGGTEPYCRLKEDGRYRIVALPGEGIIACRSDLGRYRGKVGAETIKGYDPKGPFIETEPSYCSPSNYHVLKSFDLNENAVSATVDLEVDPGRVLTVTVVDEKGSRSEGSRRRGPRICLRRFPITRMLRRSRSVLLTHRDHDDLR